MLGRHAVSTTVLHNTTLSRLVSHKQIVLVCNLSSRFLSCRKAHRVISSGFMLPSARLTKQVEFVLLGNSVGPRLHHSSPWDRVVAERLHLLRARSSVPRHDQGHTDNTVHRCDTLRSCLSESNDNNVIMTTGFQLPKTLPEDGPIMCNRCVRFRTGFRRCESCFHATHSEGPFQEVDCGKT